MPREGLTHIIGDGVGFGQYIVFCFVLFFDFSIGMTTSA